MKKTLFLIIMALCFNASISPSQAPLRGTAGQSIRMAQINQWNNMLPYAAVALGTAAVAGVARHFQKKYEAERRPINTQYAGLLQDLVGKKRDLFNLKKEKDIIDSVLDKVDLIKEYFKTSNLGEAHRVANELRAQIDSLPRIGDTEALRYVLDERMRSLEQARDEQGREESISRFIEQGVHLLGVRIRRIDPLAKELKKYKEPHDKELDKLRSLKQKAIIARWTKVGCGLACGATTLAAVYNVCNKK